jgi:hypothetical protein
VGAAPTKIRKNMWLTVLNFSLKLMTSIEIWWVPGVKIVCALNLATTAKAVAYLSVDNT